MFSTFSIYMTDELHLSKADVGWLYTINGLGVLLFQIPALSLVRRLGIARTLPWASLLDALGFALIGLGSGVPGGAIAMLTLTSAEVVFDPSHQTAIAEIADPAHRGRTYGVVGLAQTLGIACAPLIGGVLLDTIGGHHVVMWSAIAVFGLGQSVCFAAFVRRRRAVLTCAAPTVLLPTTHAVRAAGVRSSGLLALAGCPASSSGDDTYLPPGGFPESGGQKDSDCAPDVCARDGECLPSSDVRSIRVNWTINGGPASAAACMTAPDFYLQFDGQFNDGVGFAPVPCQAGVFSVDKMPSRFQAVEVGIDNGGSLGDSVFDQTGQVSFDVTL